jgi:hypothetical protein
MVISAQYQRNGISGRGFFAAIVEDPFAGQDTGQGQFLVISVDTMRSAEEDDGKPAPPSREETFVVSMENLHAGKLVDGWRGDHVTDETLREIRRIVSEEMDARIAAIGAARRAR